MKIGKKMFFKSYHFSGDGFGIPALRPTEIVGFNQNNSDFVDVIFLDTKSKNNSVPKVETVATKRLVEM